MNICPTCQGFRGFVNDSEGRAPCLCDLPPTPSRPVRTPTAPDLPAGLREAVEKALPRDRSNKHIVLWPADYAETVDQLIAAIAPFLPAPIPVTAPLPASEGTPHVLQVRLNPETEHFTEVVYLGDYRRLELELSAVQKRKIDACIAWTEAQDELASLRTLLATAEKERDELRVELSVTKTNLVIASANARRNGELADRLSADARLTPSASHAQDCDTKDGNPDGIRKPCNCGASASQSAEMEKRVEECAREIQDNMLKSLPKEHLPKNWKALNELDVATVASIIRRHFTTPTQ
jgi:hypothetical protein